MPRILDLQLSNKAFALRLTAAIGSGILSFFFLYYVPANLSTMINRILPVMGLADLIQQFIPPLLPPLGLIITVLIVLGIIFKKTMLHGPVVSITGLTCFVYTYTAFRGGTLVFNLPQTMIPDTTARVTVTLTTIMSLFLAAPACNILNGVLLALEHKRADK